MADIYGVFVLAFVAFIGGAGVGFRWAEMNLQAEAIKRGVARFNPETGAWEWTVERGDKVNQHVVGRV